MLIYAEICAAVAQLRKRYQESDPVKLCEAMGIKLIFTSLGKAESSIKGFFLESKRIQTITINNDLSEILQKIIIAHELGHAVLHKRSGIHAFHDVGLFDESSIFEKDANLFAAEYLMEDEAVLKALNGDSTFFSAASALYVPMELLDFKFRLMKWKGYQLIESPIIAQSNFLKDLEVPYHEDNYSS